MGDIDLDDDLPPAAAIHPQHGGIDGPLYLYSRSGTPEIQSARYTHGYVDANSGAFGWAGLDRLDVLSGTTFGEHVGRYIKLYRHPGASASAWGICVEGTDWSGKGNLWGAEIDVMSVGADPASLRLGIGIVVGEAVQKGAAGPTYERVVLDYGICGIPFRRVDAIGNIVPDNVFTKVWMTTQFPCEVFTAAPSGAWRTSDDGNNIGDVFDKATGFTLTGMRDRIGLTGPFDHMQAALAVQVDTGQVLSYGRQIIGPRGPTTQGTNLSLTVLAILVACLFLWFVLR